MGEDRIFRVVCQPSGYSPEQAHVGTLNEARQIADWSDQMHDHSHCTKPHTIETAVWVDVVRV